MGGGGVGRSFLLVIFIEDVRSGEQKKGLFLVKLRKSSYSVDSEVLYSS